MSKVEHDVETGHESRTILRRKQISQYDIDAVIRRRAGSESPLQNSERPDASTKQVWNQRRTNESGCSCDADFQRKVLQGVLRVDARYLPNTKAAADRIQL